MYFRKITFFCNSYNLKIELKKSLSFRVSSIDLEWTWRRELSGSLTIIKILFIKFHPRGSLRDNIMITALETGRESDLSRS